MAVSLLWCGLHLAGARGRANPTTRTFSSRGQHCAMHMRFTCTSRLFAMPCVSIACCKVARLCLSTPTGRVASHPLCRPGSDCVTHWLDRVSAACCRKKPGEANTMACHTSYHGRHAATSQSCGSRAKCELSQSDMIGVWRCACCLPACLSCWWGICKCKRISVGNRHFCQISHGLAAVTRCSLLTRTP